MSVPSVFSPMEPVTVGTCLKRSVDLYTAELGWFAGWGLAVSGLSAAMGAATAGWAFLFGLCLLVPTQIGLFAIAEAAARGQPVSWDTVLDGFRKPSAYVLGLLETTILVLAFVALILPGFVAMVALTWTTAALYRRDLGAVQAVRHSFSLTRSHLGLTVAICVLSYALSSLGTGTIVLGALTAPLVVCLKTVAFEQADPALEPLI